MIAKKSFAGIFAKNIKWIRQKLKAAISGGFIFLFH